MKASGLPKKISLRFTGYGLEVDYTRTDAFIEKACNAYCKTCKMPNCKGEDCKYIKDFRKYMEE